MKRLWIFRFELCIATSGLLLLASVFFPTSLPAGFYVCMLILFLISIVLLKLSAINEHLKNKIRKGGFL